MGPTVYVLNPQPQARYLHSAVTTDDYMLVFGGRSHYNTSNSLIAYTYSCNQWLRLLTSGVYLLIFALITVNEMIIILNSTNVFKDKFNNSVFHIPAPCCEVLGGYLFVPVMKLLSKRHGYSAQRLYHCVTAPAPSFASLLYGQQW